MNKDSFNDELNRVCSKADIKYKDSSLYYIAFTHPSFANERKLENNERLEFLGDGILDFLVAEFLYLKYPDYPEGVLTKMRQIYVCESANKNYSLFLELDKCIMLGKGEEEQGGRTKPSVLGNLFEAFLGAVYLDLGLEAVRKVLEIALYPHITVSDMSNSKAYLVDYKSRLQECIQAESKIGVKYIVEKEEGPSHDKIFTVSVNHDGLKLGIGQGKSKKEAEQKAAEDALSKVVK